MSGIIGGTVSGKIEISVCIVSIISVIVSRFVLIINPKLRHVITLVMQEERNGSFPTKIYAKRG